MLVKNYNMNPPLSTRQVQFNGLGDRRKVPLGGHDEEAAAAAAGFPDFADGALFFGVGGVVEVRGIELVMSGANGNFYDVESEGRQAIIPM